MVNAHLASGAITLVPVHVHLTDRAFRVLPLWDLIRTSKETCV